MIIEHNGKRLAFGMTWKSRLAEGDVHGDARTAKSKYFWYADKAAYFGVLAEGEDKKKQKAPLYAGAVALLHRYTDVPNLVMVLAIPKGSAEHPDGGYILCGIHQGRPRSGFDKIATSELEVSELLATFKALCGSQGFTLIGDVKISGIVAASVDDVYQGADQTALMRKTKSAMVNPLAFGSVGIVVVGAAIFAYDSYSQFKKSEAQRVALAAQKNSQQLYNEELAVRRLDGIVLAQNITGVSGPLRKMHPSIGGWSLRKTACSLPPQRQMVCTSEYARRPESKATYETFVAIAKQFDNVEFAGEIIKATSTFKSVPFTEQGKAIDAARTQRESVIEFGSNLQRLDRLGKPKHDEFKPFAMPPGANAGELTAPPLTAADWEFTTPFRNVKQLANFPSYATISTLVVTYSDSPMYEQSQSLAMVTVTGKVFSKSK